MTDRDDGWLHTDVGGSTRDSITVRGQDLATELMGEMPFGDLAFLLAAGRAPTGPESVLFNAVLAALAEHGLTPTALAARLTYTGAPEAVQGAIAAGLLGGGSVFLGPVEDTAAFLEVILTQVGTGAGREALAAAASAAVDSAIAAGRKVPGLGHPIHKETDPRTPRLYELARANGLLGPHMELLQLVSEAHESRTGRSLPINGAGAAGAALADLGFAPFLARGFALLARTAGLIGHLSEESERPIGMRLWQEIDDRAGGPG
jgi:citrate synthase